ncbi:MAG: energy-coupling factor transporter transmembrane protein EcfT [Oscillospiraceae bacterium]|nr:energy-coupling factor transporter transmembrane protein EcfT [Oscillospiraceae bacterium]
MLKNITLGQYFPGNTFVHRLDPRTKLLIIVVYIVALFLVDKITAYLPVIVFLAISVMVSKIKLKSLVSGMKPLFVIIVITAIINLFFTSGEPIVKLWVVTITKEGVRAAVFMLLRISLLIMGTFMLTYTTAPMQLTDGLESLLGPLKKIKMPVHELAMMMSIALRFIPTLIEETDKIMNAQKARGADFETGGLVQKAKAMLPLLIPLFISAFRRADELATAMESRCYSGGEGRTKMKQLCYGAIDVTAGAAAIVLLAMVILLNTFGI